MKKIILVGNPNVGKTTFFNCITNKTEHVGNWHGVTTEFKEQDIIFNGAKLKVVDLPGLYSLTSFTTEEEIARDYIYNNLSQKILVVCDINNLQRNLYLALQLLELKANVSICINMANELKENEVKLNKKALQSFLGCSVYLIDARKKEQVNTVMERILLDNPKSLFKPAYFDELYIKGLKQMLLKYNYRFNLEYICIKLLEQDEFIINSLGLKQQDKQILKQALEIKENSLEMVAGLRYNFLEAVEKECLSGKKKEVCGYSRADKYVLNKWLCLPIFFVVMLTMFFVTFSSVGAVLGNLLTRFVEDIIAVNVLSFFYDIGVNYKVVLFFEEAVFLGLGSLVAFLPQIVLLFLGISILEEVGYLSRLAFCLEDVFKKVGLTGRSVFTILMGMGCSTTAIMASRVSSSREEKIRSCLLSPYMSCSAKLPIYAVIGGAFFGVKNFFVVLFLYLLGIFTALMVSYVLNKTILKQKEDSFIMEMPKYRLPNFDNILKVFFINIKVFMLRVGTSLLVFSSLIWLLQNFSFNFNFVKESGGVSVLQNIGQLLAPVLNPIGLYDWAIPAVLICGIVAKEVIVSSIVIINGTDSGVHLQNSLKLKSSPFYLCSISAFSFLVFSLLYFPCVSTIAVMKKEIGLKWTLLAVIIQFCVAYVVTFVLYKIIVMTLNLGFVLSLTYIWMVILLVFIVLKAFSRFNNLGKCNSDCCFCKKNCKRDV